MRLPSDCSSKSLHRPTLSASGALRSASLLSYLGAVSNHLVFDLCPAVSSCHFVTEVEAEEFVGLFQGVKPDNAVRVIRVLVAVRPSPSAMRRRLGSSGTRQPNGMTSRKRNGV